MSAILSPLWLQYIDGHTWQLVAPFAYDSDVAKATIMVPAGAYTDFNSIPRAFWRVMPPTEYGVAGVVHDFGYRTGSMPRELVDKVFREALILLKAPGWKVNAMYNAVRWFGGGAYQKRAPAADAQS